MYISIAICDDEKELAEELKNNIKTYDKWEEHTYKVSLFNSGNSLVKTAMDGTHFDIAFLDIDLGDSLGTEIGVTLKKINPNILIIYISFHNSYYEKLARSEPFDFIRRPYSKEDVLHVMERAINRLHYIKQEFIYSYKYYGVTYSINLKDVMYFESQHRIINIYFSDHTVKKFYGKLDDVEKEVEEMFPYFLRVNQSYYINYNHVSHITTKSVVINNLSLTIGKKYKETYENKLEELVFLEFSY